MGNCVGCHRGDDRSDRLRIAHQRLVPGRFAHFAIPGSEPVERGKKLVQGFACRRCHTVGGKGNALASNLDRLPPKTEPQELYDAIRSPALFMPDFRMDDAKIVALVNAILAGRARARERGERPQLVHFEEAAGRRQNVFEKQCAPCHKLLSRKYGGLGKGNIGPNLSGLLTEYYPLTNGGRPWTPDALAKWLDNPRKSRPVTEMPPVRLERQEFEQLLQLLSP